jgi:flagellar biosynthesis regulator FlbT
MSQIKEVCLTDAPWNGYAFLESNIVVGFAQASVVEEANVYAATDDIRSDIDHDNESVESRKETWSAYEANRHPGAPSVPF